MYCIDKNIESTYIIKKSKFITKLYKVNSIEEVTDILNNLKDEYKDSTHICYGYIVNELEKCFDDGEPSNTAGLPILNILKKNELNNVLCVVIRYFGGIKLGAGGLIRAYSNSTNEAVKKATIVKQVPGYLVELEFSYDNLKTIDYILNSKEIISKEFNDSIIYKLILSEEEIKILKELERICIHISIKDKILINEKS